MLKELPQGKPSIDPEAFIAGTAQIIGDVTVKAHAGIWYGAIIRADLAPVTIGVYTNIQDGCTLHVDYGRPLSIGSYVTAGHRAVLHGCTVEDRCLIGMGAIVLNGAEIGEGSIIGAGALVPEGKVIPRGSLALGVPAKVVREVSDKEREGLEKWALDYYEISKLHR